MFPEAFIGGYPRGSNFGVTIGNRTAKGKEEFRKYHAAAIDVPGKNLFIQNITLDNRFWTFWLTISRGSLIDLFILCTIFFPLRPV